MSRRIRSAAILTIFALASGSVAARAAEAPEEKRLAKRVEGAIGAPERHDLEALEAFVDDVRQRLAGIDDYRVTFTALEVVDGEVQPEAEVRLKHRKRPNCAYLKWTRGKDPGREVVYCESMYEGEIQVRPSSGVSSLLGTLSIEPHGKLAMDGNRHPITRIGIYYPVQVLRNDLERAHENPDHEVSIAEPVERSIRGEPSSCWEVARPGPDLGYYAPRSELCVHRDELVPTRIRTWNGDGEIVETYTFRDFELNVGLTDEDFDVANAEYGF